jgi:hypothetical protein
MPRRRHDFLLKPPRSFNAPEDNNLSRGLVLCALLLSACAIQPHYAGDGWDGRRGYDGNGDYGYDVAASRQEAHAYRVHAARAYPHPGPASDPWGPYITESAARFALPPRWIRAVMQQESGGHLITADGTLITSPVGAMGLMQVMPTTYDILRQRYALGDDPYDPHDNIVAGAAYMREMYDRFGAPAILAAYNAGPDRVEAYLTAGINLPDETVNYLASVAPRLGPGVAMTGPLSVYAGAAGGRDPDAAFDGGGLVTAAAPTGEFTPRR